MSKVVRAKLPCSKCGSSDGRHEYSDGHSYCFVCHDYIHGVSKSEDENTVVDEISDEEETPRPSSYNINPLELPTDELTDRGINRETAEYYGVRVLYSQTDRSIQRHYYPYQKNGSILGWKVRLVADKDFFVQGGFKNVELFGQHLCHPGRLLIITEGECDAMAAHQMLRTLGKAYNVVSIPNGAQSYDSIRNNLKFIEQYETVVLMFDNDAPGIDAAEKVAKLLSIGKAKIASLPLKDPNEMLVAGRIQEFYTSLNNAQVYRPDNIIALKGGWDLLWEDETRASIPYPWRGLNELTYGIRQREITTITAGSGVGKSAIIRELEHHIWKTTPHKIGILALEESVGKTEWGMLSVHTSKPLMILEERQKLGITRDTPEIQEAYNTIFGDDRLFALDHFGSANESDIMDNLRYLIKGFGCEWIFIDHLSIIVSGMEDALDERRLIDRLMTRFRSLVEETGIGMVLVTHLRRASGDRGHEQGLEVSLSQLRGSQAIAQLSDMVIAAERNQQADSELLSNTTKLRVLKNRYAGMTGIAGDLYYDRTTGRLSEIDLSEEAIARAIAEELAERNQDFDMEV